MSGIGKSFPRNWISEIFALGNVDFRLKAPRDLKKRQKIVMDAGKSRWNTWEFRFYYLVFAIVVPLMFKAAFEATSESNPNYYRYVHSLDDGWLFGRKVDNSDSQYRFFRSKFFLLLMLMFGHISIKKAVLRLFSIEKVAFDFYFGLVFIFAAHGVNSLRVLVHLFSMYAIVRIFKRHGLVARTLLWIYGVGTLFFNDKYRLYPFGDVLSAASFLDSSYRGIIERWDVFYNFTLLRLLSFNLDYLSRWESLNSKQKETPTLYHDAVDSKQVKHPIPVETKQHSILLSDWTNESSRLNAPHNIKDYNVKNYLAYVTYTPLFIAGPILTFNDYLYQSRYTLPSINLKRIFFYAINFSCCVLLMEVILHFLYVVAASKARAWEGNTPFQTSMIGFFNLNIIWLKLLIPWRMFRLWALMDGMDPPENMIRCVDNNYSSLAFWRAWHRSYNKWVIHYIYIPLGGSSNRILTSLTVFSFVAIWHDIELKLLFWGWMIVLFLLPEIVATKYFMKYSKRSWYRHLCAIGGVVNIWTMIIANLFGFCLGYDGTVKLLGDLFSTGRGLLFSLCASSALFVGVQVMFEQREHEKRHGVYVKC